MSIPIPSLSGMPGLWGAQGGGPGSEVTVGVPGKSCLWVSETEVIKPVVGSPGSRGTLPEGVGGCRLERAMLWVLAGSQP